MKKQVHILKVILLFSLGMCWIFPLSAQWNGKDFIIGASGVFGLAPKNYNSYTSTNFDSKTAIGVNSLTYHQANLNYYKKIKDCNINLVVDNMYVKGGTFKKSMGIGNTNSYKQYKQTVLHLADTVGVNMLLADETLGYYCAVGLGYGSVPNINPYNSGSVFNPIYSFNNGANKPLPASVWGTYLADEPNNYLYTAIKKLDIDTNYQNNYINVSNSTLKRFGFVNVFGGVSNTYYTSYLSDYKAATEHEIVNSVDDYPFQIYYGVETFQSGYLPSLSIFKNRFKNKVTVYTVHSATHDTNIENETEPYMGVMSFCPIAYGFKGLCYWLYSDKFFEGGYNFGYGLGDDDSDINTYRTTRIGLMANTTTTKYQIARKINTYIKKIVGPVVMQNQNIASLNKYDTSSTSLNTPTKTVQTATLNLNRLPLSERMQYYNGIVKDISEYEMLLGIFHNQVCNNSSNIENGVYYLFVVNKNGYDTTPKKNMSIYLQGNYTASGNSISLAPRMDAIELNPNDTAYKPATYNYDSNSKLTTITLDSLNPGEGRLIKIVVSGIAPTVQKPHIIADSTARMEGSTFHICQNDVLMLSTNATANIRWYNSGTATGDTTCYAIPSTSGTYYFTVNDSLNGCRASGGAALSYSDTVTIVQDVVPPTPSITTTFLCKSFPSTPFVLKANSLTSGHSYEWLREGAYVYSNDTSNQYTLPTYQTADSSTGYYSVIDKDLTTGCYTLSNPTYVKAIEKPVKIVGLNTLCLSNTSNNTIQLTATIQYPSSNATWQTDSSGITIVGNSTSINASVTGNTTGNYNVIYSGNFNYSNRTCSSSVAFPITVINACVCIPSSTPVTLLNNQLKSGVYNNSFYSAKDSIEIVAGNTVVFSNNAVLYLDTTAMIVVNNGATLRILGCRFTTCNGLWKGIIVKKGGRLNIDGDAFGGSSLIENAQIAVLYDDSLQTSSSTNDTVVYVNNTIFNRNNIGVVIQNYTPTNSGSAMPIKIQNSVFTSRDIAANNSNSWDDILTLLGTPPSNGYPTTPLTYTAPYLVDYTADSLANNSPKVGILLNNVAMQTSGGLPVNLTIGDGGNNYQYNTNVFDNLTTGIDATQTNLALRNCTFQSPSGKGVGVKVNNEIWTGLPPVYLYGYITNNYSLDISSPVGTPNNAFFDLATAIHTTTGKLTTIRNCDIISAQDYTKMDTIAISRGKNGIDVKGTYYDALNIDSNNIYNVRNAIVYGGINYASCIGDPEMNHGVVNVTENNISKANTNAAYGSGNEYVEHGIMLSSVSYVTQGKHIANLTCSDNQLHGVINGIKTNLWQGKKTFHENNTIQLSPHPTNINYEAYGICLEAGFSSYTGGFGNTIVGNVITGSYDTTTSNPHQTGVLLNMQSNTDIECNTVSKNMHGFRFYGSNPQTKWWDNTMEADNQFGLTLDNGGIIGLQGDSVLHCTSDNVWNNPNNWNVTNNQFMTNCSNSDPANSPLMVRNSPNYPFLNPDGHGKLSGFNGNYFQHSSTPSQNSIIYDVSSTSCVRCQGLPNYKRTNLGDIGVLEDIANGSVSLPNDDATDRLKVMQQQLYDMVVQNADVLAASQDIHQFVLDNQWSSYDYIYFIQQMAASNRMSVVQQLMDIWQPLTDLDNNYRQYFEWLMAKSNDPNFTPPLTDVLTLANKCPVKYGMVVYSVRNLYNQLTGNIHQFDDNCNSGSGARMSKPIPQGFIRLKQPKKKIAVGAEYTIGNNPKLKVYPNPSKGGNVTICFEGMKNIIVTDITGRTVFNKELKYSTDKYNLDFTNEAKGMYIIKLVNSKGVEGINKCIIQ